MVAVWLIRVHHFSPDWNVSTITQWIAMKFGTGSHSAWRIRSNNSDEPQAANVMPASGQSLNLSDTSTALLSRLLIRKCKKANTWHMSILTLNLMNMLTVSMLIVSMLTLAFSIVSECRAAVVAATSWSNFCVTESNHVWYIFFLIFSLQTAALGQNWHGVEIIQLLLGKYWPILCETKHCSNCGLNYISVYFPDKLGNFYFIFNFFCCCPWIEIKTMNVYLNTFGPPCCLWHSFPSQRSLTEYG